MAKMKVVTVSGSRLQAEMLVGYLQAHGIEAFINGSREYASIVTGQDVGRFEISTDIDDAEFAQDMITKIDPASINDAKSPPSPSTLLKKAILFASLGVLIFPIFFNIASIVNLIRYFNIAEKSPKTYLWAILVLTINLTAALTILAILMILGVPRPIGF